MKLSLKNFRNHLNLELNLPETGLVRISGRSGSGKSSILHAVKFALYGKGRGVVTWNESECAVALQGMNLDLTRTKGPNKIDCNGLSAAPAELEIQRVLGMNELEFSISSYVSQGQRSSLINLTPADQLKLINSLSFRNEDPEVHREKIKEFIKIKEKHLVEQHETRSRLQERISGIEASLSSHRRLLDKPSFDIESLQIEKQEIQCQILQKKNRITELRNRNQELLQLLKSPDRENLDKAKRFLENAYDRLEELRACLEKPENQYTEYDWTAEELELKQMQSELNDLTFKHKKLKSLLRNSGDSERLEIVLAGALSKIQSVVTFGGVSREDPQLGDDLLTLKTSSEAALSALDSLKISASEDEKIESENEITAINLRIKEIHEAVQSYSEKKSAIQTQNMKAKVFRENLENLEKQIEKAEKIVELSGDIKSTAEIEKEQSEVKESGNSALSELKTAESKLIVVDSRIKEFERYQASLDEIAKLESRLSECRQHLDEANLASDKTESEHKDAQRILALWTKASLDVLESTIAEINLRAAFWLDTLLEGKVAAELKTTKRVKSTNETIDSINLEIMYKGQILERINEELSGGQYSRVMLAFQLALSDIYNSPILMLDEAARGCDAETVEMMLDALNTVSKRKLVLIVEHNIPSHHFDQEVQIAEL